VSPRKPTPPKARPWVLPLAIGVAVAALIGVLVYALASGVPLV
jgi:high-affinity Fe2+/Pb2+ permease